VQCFDLWSNVFQGSFISQSSTGGGVDQSKVEISRTWISQISQIRSIFQPFFKPFFSSFSCDCSAFSLFRWNLSIEMGNRDDEYDYLFKGVFHLLTFPSLPFFPLMFCWKNHSLFIRFLQFGGYFLTFLLLVFNPTNISEFETKLFLRLQMSNRELIRTWKKHLLARLLI
jgi:hypothetical protein